MIAWPSQIGQPRAWPVGAWPRGAWPDDASRTELRSSSNLLRSADSTATTATLTGDPGSDRDLVAIAIGPCGLESLPAGPVRLAFDATTGELLTPPADPATALDAVAGPGGTVRVSWSYRRSRELEPAAAWVIETSVDGAAATTTTLPAGGSRVAVVLGPYAHGAVVAVSVRSRTADGVLSAAEAASAVADAEAPGAVAVVSVSVRAGVAL